jgi:hypothetical protein
MSTPLISTVAPEGVLVIRSFSARACGHSRRLNNNEEKPSCEREGT